MSNGGIRRSLVTLDLPIFRRDFFVILRLPDPLCDSDLSETTCRILLDIPRPASFRADCAASLKWGFAFSSASFTCGMADLTSGAVNLDTLDMSPRRKLPKPEPFWYSEPLNRPNAP